MVSTEILVQKRVLVGTRERLNSLIPREWVCKKVDYGFNGRLGSGGLWVQ
jgi:hypothetical protein